MTGATGAVLIRGEELAQLLPAHLARQRWFGAKHRQVAGVTLVGLTPLRPQWPGLVHGFAEVRFTEGDLAAYQLLVGLRPETDPGQVVPHGDATLGRVDTELGPAWAYDALLDPELAVALLGLVAPGERAERARPLGAEQSNTSVVYDDALILKVFRRLRPGANPDVEMVQALAAAGFPWVAQPVASWRAGDYDLAFLQRYLAGGVEGWELALRSVRGLAGNFADEARMLGEVTADLHRALAAAFGVHPGDASRWAGGVEAQLRSVGDAGFDGEAPARLVADLRSTPEPGPAVRVHGDYHLGQVMRTDDGWFVLDFEGEPGRPLEERRLPTSPLKDVAGMLRSFHYASRSALATTGTGPSVPDAERAPLAAEWERRCRNAFLDAYVGHADPALLPGGAADRATVLAAFELEKAAYEVGYEQSHRPDWLHIPMDAIRRLAPTA